MEAAMNERIRWLLVPTVILLVAAGVLLLFTYEVIAVDFTVLMENQQSVEYHDGPHLAAPEGAVPVSQPAYLADGAAPANPVPADSVSIQRGQLLFSLHCALCHGAIAQGGGPVTQFWRDDAREPPNLTDARVGNLPDGAIYQFISQGIGAMPPLRYNVDERGRWDVINYLRSLQ
jgi:mono/diheme cytochrome c family protein